ncbi:NADH-quinone oxidoreductase subunit H, partial [Lactococcus lactis]|uniref:NADH-quinone oxidoreductase subunit H n=1 Tax=Lactococcus lactis TaxID=1358 RepID=UPI003D0FA67D
MSILFKCMLLFTSIMVLPFFTLGITRKTKAYMQGRIGAAVWQPALDFFKMLQKGQTISEDTT